MQYKRSALPENEGAVIELLSFLVAVIHRKVLEKKNDDVSKKEENDGYSNHPEEKLAAA
jgi:hypothetical protein